MLLGTLFFNSKMANFRHKKITWIPCHGTVKHFEQTLIQQSANKENHF